MRYLYLHRSFGKLIMVRPGNKNPKASRNRDLTAANQTRLAEADEFAMTMVEHLKAATGEGCITPSSRARWLNEKGILTQREKKWRHQGVRRLVKRIIALHAPP